MDVGEKERERWSTQGHVETTVSELAVLLTQRTCLATAMNKAVSTWAPFQHELLPQFGAVGAGEETGTTCKCCVNGAACTTT